MPNHYVRTEASRPIPEASAAANGVGLGHFHKGEMMNARFALSAMAVIAALVASGCGFHKFHNLPPAERLMHPGPGVDGPGPGVLPPATPPGAMPSSAMPGVAGPMMGAAAAAEGPHVQLAGHRAGKMLVVPPEFEMGFPGGMNGMYPSAAAAQARPTQILFAKPQGMQVRWDVTGQGGFDSQPLVCPGRQNFRQGGIYRLKLTNAPGRDGVELYPTIEVGPATARTEAYLAHNAVPVQFTEEDFDQVLTGNFVTKVIYLPDREFQELALAGVETLVSTRLDPGLDPIVEADRRGAILAIVRLGNIDPEMPGQAPMGMMMGGEIIQASHTPGAAAQPAGYGHRGAACSNCPPAMEGAVIEGGVMEGGMFPGMMCPPGVECAPGSVGYAAMPPHVAGVTAPQYGMPQSGTPIGLAGPPHIPFGGQAGLKRHVMANHTPMHIPGPTHKMRYDVAQTPGFSYPKPANHVRVHEHASGYVLPFTQPHADKTHVLNDPTEACPPGLSEECPPEYGGGLQPNPSLAPQSW